MKNTLYRPVIYTEVSVKLDVL